MADYYGTDANDVLIGSAADDTLHSSKGQDILDGGDGYDTAIIDYSAAGSAGQTYSHNLFYMYDSLYGSFRGNGDYYGTETVRVENVTFIGSVASDVVYANLINDPGNWRVSLDGGGGSGFDSVQLYTGAAMTGSAVSGTLDAGRIVLKNFEQFYLNLGSFTDNLTLIAGNDVVLAGGGDDTIDGGAGNDRLEGQDGADHLIGGDGNDQLYSTDSYGATDSGAEVDVLSGGAGNDFLAIGYGDSADGGAGTDVLTLTMLGGTAGVTVNLSAVFTGGTITVGGGTITGFEGYSTIYGTNFGDTITIGDTPYNNGANGGQQGVFGFDGNDTITGGSQVDTFDGGVGDDVLHLAGGNDFGYGNLGNDTVYGDVGNDMLDGGDGNDTIYGGADNDLIRGGIGIDALYGEAGNDLLYSRGDGFPPNSEGGVLDGGTGDDWLYAGANDTVVGGAGSDALSLDLSSATEGMLVDLRAAFSGGTGSNGTGTISGVEHYTAITGSSHDDVIFVGDGGKVSDANNANAPSGVFGGGGNDMLVGGAAADALDGGTGDDRLVGGAGNDTYTVDSSGDLVFEDANGGTDSVLYVGDTGGYYLHANVENGLLQDVGNTDFLVGNELANDLTGSYGANLLLGGGGDDTIHAGYGNDTVYGQDGDDHVFGGQGIDFVAGGAGNDVIDGEGDADALYGEDGNDTLTGGIGFDTDILVGGAGDDIIHGDTHFGDYDRMYGNTGNDSFYVDTPNDLVFEQAGEGTDTVYAGINGAGYYLYDNIENLILTDSTPFGVGNALDNRLTGNAIGNYLLGGAGNDTLNGKAGNDVLFGQAGADTFVFEHGTGGDVIGDFTAGSDKIDLVAIGYSWAQVQGAFHQNGGDLAIDLGGGDFIVLQGVNSTQLHQSDFILAGGSSAAAPMGAAMAAPAAPALDATDPSLVDHAAIARHYWHGHDSFALI